MCIGVPAVVFMSDTSRKGSVWPDAEEALQIRRRVLVTVVGKELTGRAAWTFLSAPTTLSKMFSIKPSFQKWD